MGNAGGKKSGCRCLSPQRRTPFSPETKGGGQLRGWKGDPVPNQPEAPPGLSPRSDRSALGLRVSVLPAISGVETSLRGKRTQAVVSRRENKHTDPQAEVRR